MGEESGSARSTQARQAAVASHSEPSMQDILHAIETSREAVETKIDALREDLGLLRADHRKLVQRVTTVETDVGDMKPTMITATRTLTSIEKRVHVLEQRAEDAENRARRYNIRVTGLPEKIEGTNMLGYLETWLRTEVADDGLSTFFTLERAHRVPARAPLPGRPPETSGGPLALL